MARRRVGVKVPVRQRRWCWELRKINEGPLKANLQTTRALWRHFGPGWLMFRLGYAVRRRGGLLRWALPASTWEEQSLARCLRDPRLADPDRFAAAREQQAPRFLFDPGLRDAAGEQFADWDAQSTGPQGFAEALTAGVFQYFEHLEINLGLPPDWHLNPVSGDQFPRDRHWTRIGDFATGDIKIVWEPNRFAWVYPLVRTYWRTGDERYPDLFWRLLEDWMAANPPQQGVNWKCGQEVAIRLMACCFAVWGFAGSPATTAARVARIAQLAAVSASRIEGNLSYALSQRNNHGVTESAGLWTVGLLFPEFQAAPRWREAGRASLEQQVADLVDDDGAFSQHSANYQRVLLDACVWAIRLGDVNGHPLSDALRERVLRAGDFLWHLQDELTGRLPRFGQNDGAHLLPLSNCLPEDYRPIIQATSCLSGQRRFAQGPWDEAAFWMFGTLPPKPTTDGPRRRDWYASAGGYQVLRGENGHVSVRAPRFRHRPAHADALHLDLWWRGHNIALDAGTFSYNAAPPWDNPLAGTAAHNTVQVDGLDQMDRVGRFLWLPWLAGERTAYAASARGEIAYWEGMHDGYRRLADPVIHRRAIVRIHREHWLIVDQLTARQEHAYRLHWLLADFPYQLKTEPAALMLETPAGEFGVRVACSAEAALTAVRSDPMTARGWQAPHYLDRQPALSLALEARAAQVRFATLLGPGESRLRMTDDVVEVLHRDWACRCMNPGCASPALFGRVEFSGLCADSISLA